MSIEAFLKDPGARIDFTIDWSEWLDDGDTITASIWTLETGITQYAASNTTTAATIWLTGGTHGTDYLVTNTITTNAGIIDQRTLKIQVRER